MPWIFRTMNSQRRIMLISWELNTVIERAVESDWFCFTRRKLDTAWEQELLSIITELFDCHADVKRLSW